MSGIAHWDEIEGHELGGKDSPMELTRIDLGDATGSRAIGAARLKVAPGKRTSPVHVELDEEEIFFVLAGTGLSWQDGKTWEVGPGDTIVHKAAEETHTLIAGPDGIDVLVFGERTNTTATYLPRAGVVRMDVTVEVAQKPHPWEREAAAGELEIPEPEAERPTNIVALEQAESRFGGVVRDLARSGGAERTGLNRFEAAPGQEGAPPHCHAVEEELFVILEGDGVLKLSPSPQQSRIGKTEEEHPVRAGHVVSRLAGSGIAHSFQAGENGMTLLAYGQRNTGDMIYYPRSNKILFRGLGLIARLEDLDYFDGEPA
jgi:uncharacterized cupin superfamily protein